jgi:proteasome beta subunit
MFPPEHSPGPDFNEVLRRVGLSPFAPGSHPDTGERTGTGGTPGGAWRDGAGAVPPGLLTGRGGAPFDVAHGTTICAVRYRDGVIMAGDRRATLGSAIAHRTMEKVHPADTHSGVAIAGAAGPAMEMVRVFQLQLEHYEKVEGQALSLEGKANQLSQMVRSNLAMAMQGFVVVPLFAGYDLRRSRGRIYTYDPTGGRYEETDFHADGSGGRDARTTIKLGFRDDMSREEGVELCVRALWQAADEDSATGGPDAVRGIYPTVATITAAGFEPVPEVEVAGAFERVIATMSVAEVNRPLEGTLPAAARAEAKPRARTAKRPGTSSTPSGASPSGAGATPSTTRRAKRS